MISAGQIAEIKDNAAYTVWCSIFCHICVRFQKQSVIFRNMSGVQSLLGCSQCLLLNIKGKDLS